MKKIFFFIPVFVSLFAFGQSQEKCAKVYLGSGLAYYNTNTPNLSFNGGVMLPVSYRSSLGIGVRMFYSDEQFGSTSLYSYYGVTKLEAVYWFEFLNNSKHSLKVGAGLTVAALRTNQIQIGLENGSKYTRTIMPGGFGSAWYQYPISPVLSAGLRANFGGFFHQNDDINGASQEFDLTLSWTIGK